jgi:hypothetical protein
MSGTVGVAVSAGIGTWRGWVLTSGPVLVDPDKVTKRSYFVPQGWRKYLCTSMQVPVRAGMGAAVSG